MKDFPIRLMLAGIASILLGIFIQMDPDNDWYGSAFFLAVLGVLLVIIGLFYEFIKKYMDK